MLNRIIQLYKKSFQGLSRDIWLLSLVMLINRSGSMVLPFMSLFFTNELEMSLSRSGILMALFGIGSVTGQWLGGRLTDKLGAYPVQFWSLLLGGFTFMSMIFVHTFEMWCVVLPIAGVIVESFRPANMASIDVYSKPENRTRSLTLIRLAVNLGFSIGPAAAGVIAAKMGFDWLFIIDGLTCIMAAFLFRFLLKNKRKTVTKAEREENETATTIGLPKKVLSPYRDKIFMIFVGVNLLISIAFLQFLFTLPVYYEQGLALSKESIGMLLAFNGFFIFLFEMPLIYFLEKEKELLKLLVIGTTFFVFAFAGLAFFPWAIITIPVMFLLTIGEMITFPFAASFSLSRANDENRGAYMGAFGMSWSIGFVIAPYLGMKLADVFGWAAMWSLMVFFCIIAVLAMWWLMKSIRN